MKRTHGQLVTAVCKMLAAHGVLHTQTQMMPVPLAGGKGYRKSRATAGWPDVTAMLRGGRLWGIEVKVGRDKMSPAQVAVAEAIEAGGGLFTECRDDVSAVFQALKERKP